MGLIHKMNKQGKKTIRRRKKSKTYLALNSGKVGVKRDVEHPDLKKMTKYSGTNRKLNIDVNKLRRKIEAKSGLVKSIASAKYLGLKDRVPSGIPGLDQVMEGGFVRNSVNLIGGGAGCGKTILCMQFIMNGIKNYNENGVYISFEEDAEQLQKNMAAFGWNVQDLIKRNKLIILNYTPEQVAKVVASGGGTVRDAIESVGARRVVLDSLTAFTLLHEDELETRKAVLDLFETMKRWKVTALMTSESEPDPDRHKSTIMEFEVDGVVLLYNIRKGDVRDRSLEVFKMRATRHSNKIFPMKITDNGVRIFPSQTVF